MKDLKVVAYHADDVLDDFHYEALRHKAHAGDSTTWKVLRYFTYHNPHLFRFKMSRKLKNVLDKINDLVAEMNTFGLVEHTEVPEVLCRQTHSGLEEPAEIFGRDDDKDMVVKVLLNQQAQLNVQVLPIIGMGGLGKTTLAKLVYNDCRIQKYFELKMWHCVSENFKPIAVVKSVIELATNGRCDLPDTIELLRGKLQEVIGRKRFLLALDDVWNEERHRWEDDLKPLLCSSIGGPGSVIVITSRSHRVAFIAGTLPPHELECLSEVDSWKLFSKRAFSKGVQEQAQLVTIGRYIVRRCKGLPLALKTMGGLMSSKQDVQEWEAMIESNMGDNIRGKDEIMSILKLSYRHLSPEMKQCFAFFAVFPKDYEIEKDKLIQMWMANNFIHEEGTMDLYQKGEFIFNHLIWRSFIQEVTLVERIPDSDGPTRYLIRNGCKLHDLMHDLAIYVSDECATADGLIQQKASINDVRHLNISSANDLEQIGGLFKGTTSLRTLFMPSNSRQGLVDTKLVSLRVLCCPCVIHDQLMQTTHLRYLDLSWSGIVRLPDSVCKLYNLQLLRLNNCSRLRYLPEGMATMRNLSHLYLLGCHRLQRMPPKLSLLHNLHTLTTFIVGTEDGYGIDELKDLRQVGNRLELYNLRNVGSMSKANLHEKQNLSELLFFWGRGCTYMPTNAAVPNEIKVLQSLVPHPHSELRILEMHGYRGPTIAQWMRDPKMFQCLRELRISNCPRCMDFPVVWLSSSLEFLFLSHMYNLTTLCNSTHVGAAGHNTSPQIFPKLKRMELNDLPELATWAENSAGESRRMVMFPQLEELIIWRCHKLASLPESSVLKRLECRGDSANGVVPMSMPLRSWPSLVHLKIELLADVWIPLEDQQGCRKSQRPLGTLRSLELMNDDGFISVFNLSKLRHGLQNCLAFLEELSISSWSYIVCWPVEEFRCLPRLRSLRISDCRKLEGKGSSKEILQLPQLERLRIICCDSLLEIPKLPTSLEEMNIFWCPRLVALPSNLGNLPKLRKISVSSCRGLQALPDGMDRLTSLEVLVLSKCPGIKEFPQGLLQRLPALKSIGIDGCPDLQRHCREGGQYFGLVSSIPEKNIPTAELETKNPETRNFIKTCLHFAKL
ncbi:hypothetical protein PAHAL_6G290500 [Panicum hallii]|uniref:Uncharacterized protein n=2 Tax=Panicum hallii TaxID=206008 RepID=A0A2S3I3N7_9POAL|nr:putative disease resistance protein RGA3 isoform X2 [Panicum hallii]PAN36066.2 hypothetical protein PAHAL_6G290500 [Panicum hallii]